MPAAVPGSVRRRCRLAGTTLARWARRCGSRGGPGSGLAGRCGSRGVLLVQHRKAQRALQMTLLSMAFQLRGSTRSTVATAPPSLAGPAEAGARRVSTSAVGGSSPNGLVLSGEAEDRPLRHLAAGPARQTLLQAPAPSGTIARSQRAQTDRHAGRVFPCRTSADTTQRPTLGDERGSQGLPMRQGLALSIGRTGTSLSLICH